MRLVQFSYIEDACEEVYKCTAASVTSSSARLEALLNATVWSLQGWFGTAGGEISQARSAPIHNHLGSCWATYFLNLQERTTSQKDMLSPIRPWICYNNTWKTLVVRYELTLLHLSSSPPSPPSVYVTPAPTTCVAGGDQVPSWAQWYPPHRTCHFHQFQLQLCKGGKFCLPRVVLSSAVPGVYRHMEESVTCGMMTQIQKRQMSCL